MLEQYFGHRNIISGHFERFILRKPILVPKNAQGGTGIFGTSFGVKTGFRRVKMCQMTRNDFLSGGITTDTPYIWSKSGIYKGVSVVIPPDTQDNAQAHFS